MSRLERMRAELELAELEEAFAEKRLAGDITSEDRAELRQARREFRETYRVPADNGVQPDTIGAEAEVEEV